MKMKNEMCLALIILAILPAYAQKATSPSCPADGEPVTVLAQDYAARVDGLLQDVHASLQKISERMEAGSLTPPQAQELKLAATRDAIARLDTLSAVYDARLQSKDNLGGETESAGHVFAADKAEHTIPNARGTVSVEELRREAAAAAVTPRAGEAADDSD
jgi:hypothetical protein